MKVLLSLSLSRYLLLWFAEHQKERLYRLTTEHAGLRLHACTAWPVSHNDERHHFTDQLVQQGALQVPNQCLFPNKKRQEDIVPLQETLFFQVMIQFFQHLLDASCYPKKLAHHKAFMSKRNKWKLLIKRLCSLNDEQEKLNCYHPAQIFFPL